MPTIGCLSRLRTFRTKSSISSTESGSSCKPREQSALRVQDRSKTHAHAASNARGDCGQRTGRAHNKARAHTPRSVPTPRYGNNHQHACAGLPRECRRYAMDKANSTRAHASVSNVRASALAPGFPCVPRAENCGQGGGSAWAANVAVR